MFSHVIRGQDKNNTNESTLVIVSYTVGVLMMNERKHVWNFVPGAVRCSSALCLFSDFLIENKINRRIKKCKNKALIRLHVCSKIKYIYTKNIFLSLIVR